MKVLIDPDKTPVKDGVKDSPYVLAPTFLDKEGNRFYFSELLFIPSGKKLKEVYMTAALVLQVTTGFIADGKLAKIYGDTTIVSGELDTRTKIPFNIISGKLFDGKVEEAKNEETTPNTLETVAQYT